MAKIVNLVRISGRHARFQVNLDDGTSLELEGIVAISLSPGQELTSEHLELLKRHSLDEEAYERALHYLSVRPRSEAEIRKYLADKHLESTADEVISRLKRVGLVDDAAFAKQWVDNRNSYHPRGKWALRAELRRAGIADSIIDQALADVDDLAVSLAAGERKAWQLRREGYPIFRQKMIAFLQRKGFGYEIAQKTTKELWEKVQEELSRSEADGVPPIMIDKERN